jgi:hypothetical protein
VYKFEPALIRNLISKVVNGYQNFSQNVLTQSNFSSSRLWLEVNYYRTRPWGSGGLGTVRHQQVSGGPEGQGKNCPK